MLAHDLLPTTPLFDGDLPTHADKSSLVSKIESELDLTDWKTNSHIETHVVVDVMAKMRQMPIGDFSTFGALIDAVIKSTINFCKEASCIHMVFDSYVELSLKECERLRRTTVNPIDVVGMDEDTPIPHQQDKFWASEKNKQHLQLLFRQIVTNRPTETPVIIASSMIFDDEVLPAKASSGEEIPNLHSWIEEADARLLVHVNWAVRAK